MSTSDFDISAVCIFVVSALAAQPAMSATAVADKTAWPPPLRNARRLAKSAAEAGKSAESLLIKAVLGSDEVSRMPAQGDPLTPAQIGLLKSWIDEGAKAPDEESKDEEHENPARSERSTPK